MQHAQMVPLDMLARSENNVRKTAIDAGIAELATSIERDGLLQNLVVMKGSHGRFEVVAGGRRLAALRLLAKERKIPGTFPVPCHVVEPNDAEAISLAENQLREAMHPADQFEAFKARIDAGEPIADVAARFGVTETFVRQRLRLCEVAPDLIQAFRDGKMTLEVLQAFTVTSNHQRQREVWERFEGNDGRFVASMIKSALSREQFDSKHKLVKFVGLKAYQKAGGATTEDLFASADDDDDAGAVTISDPELLTRLAEDKLAKRAAKLKKDEGLSWCEPRFEFGWNERNEFGKVPTVRLEMTPEQAKEYADLEEQMLEALQEDEIDDEDLEEEIATLEEKRDAIDEALTQPHPDALQYAGAVVSINDRGQVEIHRNLIRPEDAKKLKPIKAAAKAESSAAGGDAQDTGPKGAHSMALIRKLTAHKTAILRDQMMPHAGDNTLALVFTVYQMLAEDLAELDPNERCLTMRTSALNTLERLADDIEGSPAAERTLRKETELLDPISLKLSESADLQRTLLGYLLPLPVDHLLKLLAVCVAKRLDVVGDSEQDDGLSWLVAERLLNDKVVAHYWKPTRASYLDYVSKPVIIQAVTEARGAEAAAPLSSMKKADAAEKAEELLAGTGWLPSPLRTGR